MMKKQITLLAIVTLGFTASVQSAALAVAAYMTTFPTEAKVGKPFKVNAYSISIESSNPEEVIEISEKTTGTWMIKPLKAGEVTINLNKNKAGYRHKKHPCTHVLTVTDPKAKIKKDVDQLAQDIETGI